MKNMTMRTQLTVAEGIEIQRQDLERWAKVLKPECHVHLAFWCAKHNAELRRAGFTGYDVKRGDHLWEFVANRLMRGNENHPR
jgi:hypothetical protein